MTTPEERTPGEQLFEEYLRSQGLEFVHEKPFPGKRKHPDYSVPTGGLECLFEVKDATSQPQPGVAMFDPYEHYRERIKRAREKFKEFKGYPCALVVVPMGSLLLHDPKIVFGAMHGDVVLQARVDPRQGRLISPWTEKFGGRGLMTRPHWGEPQNTTISAVVVLRAVRIGVKRFVSRYLPQFGDNWKEHMEDEPTDFDKAEVGLGVAVYENRDAAIPLPQTVCVGHFDERWVLNDEGPTCIFEGAGVLEAKALTGHAD